MFFHVIKIILYLYRIHCLSHHISVVINIFTGLPWWLSGKESTCNAGDMGSIPGLGSSPGEGNGYPLQYSAWRTPQTEDPGGL